MFGEPTYFFLDGCEFSAKSRLVLASGFRISITDHAAASTTLKSPVNDHVRQEKNTCKAIPFCCIFNQTSKNWDIEHCAGNPEKKHVKTTFSYLHEDQLYN